MTLAGEERKLKLHIGANLISFALVGSSGVLMILGLARIFGAAAVGVFDQVYSIYIVLSQIVAAGVHLSVLKYSAQHESDVDERDTSLTAALVTVGIGAGAVVTLIYPLRHLFTGWLGSAAVNDAVSLVFPGLYFFALNKVLLAYLNGCRMMLAFAAFQSLRSLMLLVSLAGVACFSRDGLIAPVIFSVAEAVVFLCLALYVSCNANWRWNERSRGWVREHLSFGLRGAGAPLLAELNTRINVLILGAFAVDGQVGVFSLTMMIFDGYNQLSVVARNVFNPLLTQAYGRSPEDLAALAASTRQRAYRVMLPFAALIVAGFPVLVTVFRLDPAFSAGLVPLALLMCGAAVNAGYVPIGNILSQTGHPGAQSFLSIAVCGTNAALNALLVPWLGMVGAAAGTAGSSLLQVVYFRRLVHSRLGLTV